MKTALRSLFFFAMLGISSGKLHAQCAVSDIFIQNVRLSGVQVPGSCTITFDITFNIEDNNGNKFIFIHEWIQSQYPNYFQCSNGQTTRNGAIHAPKAPDLVNAFINIGIDNSTDIPTILTSYPADNSVVLTTVTSIIKIVLPDGSVNFTLQGITATYPVSCGTPVVVVADLWSSQSASAQIAHCVNCGILSSEGYMSVAGFIICGSPLRYTATLTNNTAIALNGYYRVYADVNYDGYFTPTTDTLISGPINYSVAAGVGTTSSISGSIPDANLNQDIFLVFTQTTGSGIFASRVFTVRTPECAVLPVILKSFTAKRVNSSNVTLRWETVTEINNNGFDLQSNMGDNKWQSVGFITSQARNGNSNAALIYTYNDLNAARGITQYRLRQVDIDGKSKFSEIRTVRSVGQKGKTIVYPNPSADGRVNVVFEEKEGTRNAALSDMNGRLIRKWKITNGNTIHIDNLEPGIYIMQITIMETGEQTVEKIIVAGVKTR